MLHCLLPIVCLHLCLRDLSSSDPSLLAVYKMSKSSHLKAGVLMVMFIWSEWMDAGNCGVMVNHQRRLSVMLCALE